MSDPKHNQQKLTETVANAIKQVRSLKEERAAVNADIAEVRSSMQALGISKKAFDMAMVYQNMDPDDRQGFDLAYAICREAAGLPIQRDLFDKAHEQGKVSVAITLKEPDPTAIEKHITAEAEAAKGKKIHEPTGEHQGAIN